MTTYQCFIALSFEINNKRDLQNKITCTDSNIYDSERMNLIARLMTNK